MKNKHFLISACFIVFLGSLLLFNLASAQKKPAEPIMLKLEGAKLAPVPFSHTSHAEKEKIACVVCHHKDKDTKEPQPCVACHMLKEVKDNAAPAKEAFHKNCQTCHKESVAKGRTAQIGRASCRERVSSPV